MVKKINSSKKNAKTISKFFSNRIKNISFYISIFILFLFITFSFFTSVEDNHSVYVDSESELQINYDINKLQNEYQNTDIIAYLYIPDILSYPIVKSSDNDYYLNHQLDHSENIKGSPFMDYRVNFEDRKILIYGHSGKQEDLPFLILHKYEDESFYKKHPRIFLFSKKKKYTYDIFSSYIEKNDFDYVNINSFRGLTWKEHLEKLKNKSNYNIPVTLNDDSKILILQTCNEGESLQKGKYKLIIALLTNIESNE